LFFLIGIIVNTIIFVSCTAKVAKGQVEAELYKQKEALNQPKDEDNDSILINELTVFKNDRSTNFTQELQLGNRINEFSFIRVNVYNYEDYNNAFLLKNPQNIIFLGLRWDEIKVYTNNNGIILEINFKKSFTENKALEGFGAEYTNSNFFSNVLSVYTASKGYTEIYYPSRTVYFLKPNSNEGMSYHINPLPELFVIVSISRNARWFQDINYIWEK
jgi:hypothetical protein